MNLIKKVSDFFWKEDKVVKNTEEEFILKPSKDKILTKEESLIIANKIKCWTSTIYESILFCCSNSSNSNKL